MQCKAVGGVILKFPRAGGEGAVRGKRGRKEKVDLWDLHEEKDLQVWTEETSAPERPALGRGEGEGR